jgi:hypothetical protein
MEVFNVPHYLPPHPELEYAIPLNATVNAILELIAIQEELKHEISFNLITEVISSSPNSLRALVR